MGLENRVSRVAISLRRDERKGFFRPNPSQSSLALDGSPTPSSSRGARGLLCFAHSWAWFSKTAKHRPPSASCGPAWSLLRGVPRAGAVPKAALKTATGPDGACEGVWLFQADDSPPVSSLSRNQNRPIIALSTPRLLPPRPLLRRQLRIQFTRREIQFTRREIQSTRREIQST